MSNSRRPKRRRGSAGTSCVPSRPGGARRAPRPRLPAVGGHGAPQPRDLSARQPASSPGPGSSSRLRPGAPLRQAEDGAQHVHAGRCSSTGTTGCTPSARTATSRRRALERPGHHGQVRSRRSSFQRAWARRGPRGPSIPCRWLLAPPLGADAPKRRDPPLQGVQRVGVLQAVHPDRLPADGRHRPEREGRRVPVGQVHQRGPPGAGLGPALSLEDAGVHHRRVLGEDLPDVDVAQGPVVEAGAVRKARSEGAYAWWASPPGDALTCEWSRATSGSSPTGRGMRRDRSSRSREVACPTAVTKPTGRPSACRMRDAPGVAVGRHVDVVWPGQGSGAGVRSPRIVVPGGVDQGDAVLLQASRPAPEGSAPSGRRGARRRKGLQPPGRRGRPLGWPGPPPAGRPLGRRRGALRRTDSERPAKEVSRCTSATWTKRIRETSPLPWAREFAAGARRRAGGGADAFTDGTRDDIYEVCPESGSGRLTWRIVRSPDPGALPRHPKPYERHHRNRRTPPPSGLSHPGRGLPAARARGRASEAALAVSFAEILFSKASPEFLRERSTDSLAHMAMGAFRFLQRAGRRGSTSR